MLENNNNNNNNNNNFVWYITGTSQGFGFILTILLLKRGYQVSCTTRNKKLLEKKIFENHVDENENDNNNEYKELLNGITREKYEANILISEVSLSDENSVKSSIDETILKFGRLDVVVNNGGYIKLGAVEELSDREYRDIFDINFFGMLNVLRHSLPLLREFTKSNKYGGCRVYNISSIAGILNLSAGSSPYSSTKFAMEAVSESLYLEMKPHNVHISDVKPGYFKTGIRESCQIAQNPLNQYSNVREAINQRPNWTFNGDPEKAMNILIDLALNKNTTTTISTVNSADNHNFPPLHLFLGPETIELFNKKHQALESDLNQFKHLTISTNFN